MRYRAVNSFCAASLKVRSEEIGTMKELEECRLQEGKKLEHTADIF